MPDDLPEIQHRADLAGEVARALGSAIRTSGGWRAPCPVHGGKDANLSLRNGDAVPLLVKCWSHGCDPLDILADLRRRGLLDDERREAKPRNVVPMVKLPLGDKPSWLFGKAVSIKGTPAERYLVEVRGTLVLPPHSAVRFMPARPPKFPWPSMVALVTDLADANRVLSLHFTDLLPSGSGKAPTDPNKRMLAGYPVKGGVIRLTDDCEITTRLGLAEGIEKCLSISTSHVRDLDRIEHVWSGISALNMENLPVVPGIETLAIYGDKNDAGRKAVAALKERWLDAGREIETHFPPGADWDEAP
jgi:hypothetical protein